MKLTKNFATKLGGRALKNLQHTLGLANKPEAPSNVAESVTDFLTLGSNPSGQDLTHAQARKLGDRFGIQNSFLAPDVTIRALTNPALTMGAMALAAGIATAAGVAGPIVGSAVIIANTGLISAAAKIGVDTVTSVAKYLKHPSIPFS